MRHVEKRSDFSAQDIQTTLSALTAKTIADAMKEKEGDLFLCGGGANNTFLCEQLQGYLPEHVIYTTEKIGLHPQWIEAAAFAWLAKQTIERKSGNLPSVTGASEMAVLGGVYPTP